MANPEDRSKFRQLQLVRAVIAVIATLFIVQVVDFGIETGILAFAVVCGITIAGYLLSRGKKFHRVFFWHLALYLAAGALFKLSNAFIVGGDGPAEMDFYIPRLVDDLWLVFGFYVVSFLATWAFWTISNAVTLEAVVFSGFLVWLLSGHRNYRLDAPKQISSLSWKIEWFQSIGAQPQHLLLALGVIYFFLLISYFVLASNRPVLGRAQTIKSYGPSQKLIAVICPLLMLAALGYYAWFLNDHYSVNIARASNGVGPTSDLQQGDSNLGFNSAVTATRQPAAMLRLEGDYVSNPTAPMLYLREGALSEFSRTELVKAAPRYDTDVPRVGLGQAFFSPDEEEDDTRRKLVQSIYLISKHAAPFAVDTPKRIRPIRNPKPERFQFAYQALSMAPTVPLQELVGSPVGDSDWDEATWKHYLRAPGSNSANPIAELIDGESPVDYLDEHGEDSRYRSLAKKLTDGRNDPILKAANIIEYLSKSSIYTRTPGHTVDSGGDPVAPYLFSEKKKGYCVHFAHAAVYLMRLSGIPSRIATGYQTDLTYSKDGHVLLMMGDRHAWPEMYIEGRGWTVFDITPAEAENEPELIPDENLLEQLMSELDPAPEFIDPLPEDEMGEDKKSSILANVINSRVALAIAVLLLLCIVAVKLFLLFGYKLVKDKRRKVRLAYLSFATRMHDRALPRYLGETRQEYADRLLREHGINASAITSYAAKNCYAKQIDEVSTDELSQALRQIRNEEDSLGQRVLYAASIANPVSLSRVRSM